MKFGVAEQSTLPRRLIITAHPDISNGLFREARKRTGPAAATATGEIQSVVLGELHSLHPSDHLGRDRSSGEGSCLRGPPYTRCRPRSGSANRNCTCRGQCNRCPPGKCPGVCDRSSRDRSYPRKRHGDQGDCRRTGSYIRRAGSSEWASRSRRVHSRRQCGNCFP
jgi:hypothetical protein